MPQSRTLVRFRKALSRPKYSRKRLPWCSALATLIFLFWKIRALTNDHHSCAMSALFTAPPTPATLAASRARRRPQQKSPVIFFTSGYLDSKRGVVRTGRSEHQLPPRHCRGVIFAVLAFFCSRVSRALSLPRVSLGNPPCGPSTLIGQFPLLAVVLFDCRWSIMFPRPPFL